MTLPSIKQRHAKRVEFCALERIDTTEDDADRAYLIDLVERMRASLKYFSDCPDLVGLNEMCEANALLAETAITETGAK